MNAAIVSVKVVYLGTQFRGKYDMIILFSFPTESLPLRADSQHYSLTLRTDSYIGQVLNAVKIKEIF